MDTSAQASNLRSKLKLRSLSAREQLKQKHPHVNSFFDLKNFDLSQIRQHSAKLLAAGTIGGSLLLSNGQAHAQSLPLPEPLIQSLSLTNSIDGQPDEWLSQHMQKLLPPIHNAFALPVFTQPEEKLIGRAIEKATGIKATASLEGERLNTIYGNIGAEQHLRRWPGDTIDQHGEFAHVEGMAPGNGGFGYFARGLNDTEGIEREKYYVAVQLMYLPDWNKRLRYLVDWYKFRKVIVVNPENGHAVVAVVGDAGPAAWTGKHFGGSPEVMHELGGGRYKKGPVVLLFVDDPENKVPLGPIDASKRIPGTININNLIQKEII